MTLRRLLLTLVFGQLLLSAAARPLGVQGAEQDDDAPFLPDTVSFHPIFSHYVGYAGMTVIDGEQVPWFVLGDIYIFPEITRLSPRQQKKYYKIAANIKKVYPLAVEIQHLVEAQIAHMDSLPDKKSRDAYINKMEKELMAEYKPRLKKLSFSQGKLLIKLIDRQCNRTSYELIRTYMGSFKATFYNAFASLFGASLKKQYDPEVDDRLTERAILLIESGQL